jgi:Mlc titration factor MtfA (ptsG expression regulator)
VRKEKIDEQIENIVAGQVQPFQNQHYMILSKNALEQGFNNMKDRTNVGIHEFAHILDEADGVIDGIPKHTSPRTCKAVEDLMERKCRILRCKNKINTYGATSAAEFFAVVTEYFFERLGAYEETAIPVCMHCLPKHFSRIHAKRYNIDFKELHQRITKK